MISIYIPYRLLTLFLSIKGSDGKVKNEKKKNKLLYVHRFSVHRNRLPTARLSLKASEQPFAQGRLSTSSAGLSACSGNLLIFLSGCAAYGLLFKQTRAMRSNNVFKAIAMLAKLAKICQRCALGSEAICTLMIESN